MLLEPEEENLRVTLQHENEDKEVLHTMKNTEQKEDGGKGEDWDEVSDLIISYNI